MDELKDGEQAELLPGDDVQAEQSEPPFESDADHGDETSGEANVDEPAPRCDCPASPVPHRHEKDGPVPL